MSDTWEEEAMALELETYTLHAKLAACEQECKRLREANEIVLSSREQLLQTFCLWAVEYQQGKMALRRVPDLEQKIEELRRELKKD